MSVQEKMTAIADAIRGKTGGAEALNLDEMAAQIAALEVGGGVDTSDATATAGDIAKGLTAYGKNGLITGTLLTLANGSTMGATASRVFATNSKVTLQYNTASDRLLRKGSMVYMNTEAKSFGTAAASDVAEGKTFTSAAGLLVTGTASIGATVSGISATQETKSLSISFSGLSQQPKMFALFPLGNLTLGTTEGFVQSVVFDGSDLHGSYGMNGQNIYTASGYSWSYADGVLTVTSASGTDGGYFAAGLAHQLVYAV